MQKKGFLTKIVIVLVLVAFLSVGISSYDFGNRKVLAKVGKSKIYVDDFEATYKREIAYLRDAWGAHIDETQLEAFGLSGIILRDMINNRIVDNVIHKINLDINDDSVIAFIKNHEIFQKEDGTFDREKFLIFLQNKQISEKDYIKKVKEDFLRKIFFKIFALKHVDYQKIAEKIYENKLEKRAVEIIKIPYDKIGVIKKPTTEELIQYYDAHKDIFMKPEQRSANLFYISKKHLPQEIATKEEIKAEFDSMGLDKKFTLKYAFFLNKEDAENIVVGTPSDVKSFWQTNNNITVLSDVFKSDIPADIQNVVAELEVGKMSPIIETEVGYYIVFLEKIQKISDADREANYKIIQSGIQEHKKAEKFDGLMLQIRNALDNGKSLEEIANTNSILEVKKFTQLTESADSKLENKIIREIFNAKINEPTDFIEDSKGNYYAVEVKEIAPEHMQSFSEAKDLVEQYWQAEKRFETASMLLIKSIKDNDLPINKISKEEKIFSSLEIAQDSEPNQHPYSQGYKSEFIDNIFSLKNIGDMTNPIEKKSSVIVGVLKEKILPKNINPEEKKENIKKINKTIKDVLHNSLLEEFIHYYSKIFKVETNDK